MKRINEIIPDHSEGAVNKQLPGFSTSTSTSTPMPADDRDNMVSTSGSTSGIDATLRRTACSLICLKHSMLCYTIVIFLFLLMTSMDDNLKPEYHYARQIR